MAPERVEQLADGQLTEVLGLVRTATRVDRVAPLSEQVLLAARDRVSDTSPGSTTGSGHRLHLLAYAGTHLVGYAHLERDADGEAGTAEVLVDPEHRRRGIGTELVHALEGALEEGTPPEASQSRHLRVWSHGDLQGARALARRNGFSALRELWQMCRSLGSDAAALPAASLPEGFTTRHFVVGRDEDAWLRLNAAAFVNHPEQGRMKRHDLDQRVAEPWFDPVGLILIEDIRGLKPVLAASHWTKVVPTDGSTIQPADDPTARPTEGEVYVVGVDPAYQGMGLGRTVTVLGLGYLQDRGLTKAMLYVDADNQAAVATYSALDFVRSAVDIMYSRIVHTSV